MNINVGQLGMIPLNIKKYTENTQLRPKIALCVLALRPHLGHIQKTLFNLGGWMKVGGKYDDEEGGREV